MKMKLLIGYILLFAVSFCNAQEENVDELKAKLNGEKSDSTKTEILLKISRAYLSTEPKDAIPYATQAKELARKIEYKKGLAQALKNIGIAYYQQSMYIEALENWNQSLAVYESISDTTGIANLQSNIGAIYKNQGNDTKALEYLFNSLRNSEQTGDKKRITTALVNIGSVYQHKTATNDKALEYYKRALPMSEELEDNDLIGTTAANIGEIYLQTGKNDSALIYLEKAQIAFMGTVDISYALNYIGKAFAGKKDYAPALDFQKQAYDSARKMNSTLYMTAALQSMGDTYFQKGDFKLALNNYLQAEKLSKELNSSYDLKNSYGGLALSYSKLGDYKNAFRYQELFSVIKDTIYNKENDLKLSNYEFNFEIAKKKGQIDLLEKDNALQALSIERTRLTRNALMGGLALILAIVVILYRNYRNKIKVNKLLDKQNEQIEGLLLNILPAEVSKELQVKGVATPRFYESVTVLFTDFKGFTTIADNLLPQEVVAELSECFTTFDGIIEKNGLEKIKTIGDSYMCAGGIPVSNTTHPYDMANAALEILQYMNDKNEFRKKNGLIPWELRIGIHTGPIVAGVVGKKKYAYDIWGSTVNIASRMESNGQPGEINISMATFELIKDKYDCSYRGKIYAKNVGEIDMYFIKQSNTSEMSIAAAIEEIKVLTNS